MTTHKNPIRRIWAKGHAVLNGWLSISSPFSAEIMASAGYDSITIDLQHGAVDYTGMLPMLQAVRASGVATLARASWLDAGSIMKILDAGAWGVICPMINTRADAERLVSYVRYPLMAHAALALHGPTLPLVVTTPHLPMMKWCVLP